MKNSLYKNLLIPGLTGIFLLFTFSCNELDVALPEPGEEIGIGETPGEAVKILVDGTHDGGVWWFPQSGTFDQEQYHQGTKLADYLRKSGFIVDELGRNTTISDAVLEGYGIVIRAGGFSDYTEGELQAYERALNRGISLLLLSDHKTHDTNGDRLAESLGLQIVGTVNEYYAANGAPMADVTDFSEHTITSGIEAINNIPAASALINEEMNKEIKVLGRFSDEAFADLNFDGIRDQDEPVAMAFMGILNHPSSKVFFMTDINSIQRVPEQLVDNIKNWIKE